jgi:hypothetical protein
MEMCLLDTLAMVTLRVGQTEQTFLQEVTILQSVFYAGTGPTTLRGALDLLFSIPERKSDVLQTMGVRYSGNAVLAPAERPRSCVIMGEVAPGIAIFTVILSDCTVIERSLAFQFPNRYQYFQVLTCSPLSLGLYQRKRISFSTEI